MPSLHEFKGHMISIYCPKRRILPNDICYIILGFAGLVHRGRSSCHFLIYF